MAQLQSPILPQHPIPLEDHHKSEAERQEVRTMSIEINHKNNCICEQIHLLQIIIKFRPLPRIKHLSYPTSTILQIKHTMHLIKSDVMPPKQQIQTTKVEL